MAGADPWRTTVATGEMEAPAPGKPQWRWDEKDMGLWGSINHPNWVTENE